MPPPVQRPYAVTPQLAWRLAAALFFGCVLVAIPAVLLLGTSLDPTVFGITLVAILSGFACLTAPGREVDQRWLKLVPLVAVAEIAVAVQATDYDLAYLYFFAALYVAVVFPTLREMAPYLALIGVALLLGFLFGGDIAQENGPLGARDRPAPVVRDHRGRPADGEPGVEQADVSRPARRRRAHRRRQLPRADRATPS